MRVIEVDGVYTKEFTVPAIDLTTAQRVSVLVTAKNTTDKNFAMVGAMETSMFDKIPNGLNPSTLRFMNKITLLDVTTWIVYNPGNTNPAPVPVDRFYNWDDTSLVPLEPEPVIEPDESHKLDVLFETLGDGKNYAMFNHISYKPPIVPTLLTTLSVPANYSIEPTVYGKPSLYVPHCHRCLKVVHLHGHVFQVIYRSEEDSGPYNDSIRLTFADNPMRRDTVQVKPNGFVILRFRADNPGIWLVIFFRYIQLIVISFIVILVSPTFYLS